MPEDNTADSPPRFCFFKREVSESVGVKDSSRKQFVTDTPLSLSGLVGRGYL